MLGSEYNWLISLTRTSHGVPQVRLSRSGLFTLSIALICFLGVALDAGSSPRVGLTAESGTPVPTFVAVSGVKPALESSPSGSIHPFKLHQ